MTSMDTARQDKTPPEGETKLRGGITTGSCAALAAKAAALLLFKQQLVKQVEITLPDQSILSWSVESVRNHGNKVTACVIKDAGDDPDITHGARICVTIEAIETVADDQTLIFKAGDGVGTVTKAGLALDVGEAAINPVPRQMIATAIRQITSCGVSVTVAVDGGSELANKTFNPKLGISGGISIIGTTGRVRPFSAPALRESLKCALNICLAAGTTNPVFVPGNMGYKAAQRFFNLHENQVVEVSNEWGYMLQQIIDRKNTGEASTSALNLTGLLLVGHPGKLGKLAAGQWQTHSAQSDSAVPFITNLADKLLGRKIATSNTVEELFMQNLDHQERLSVAQELATAIRSSISQTYAPTWSTAVVLINLQGEIIGHSGELKGWE